MTFMISPVKAVASAFVVAAAIVAATSADAQSISRSDASPSLRRAAVVEGDVVTLGDLVEGCATLCATPLFRAPDPGESGTIQASRVIAAARESGLMNVAAGRIGHVLVTRTGRAATREEIDAALAQAIGARISADAADVSLTIEQPYGKLSLAAHKDAAPAVFDLTIDPRAGRFSASVAAEQGGAAAVRISGSYVEMASVPVLSRALQRGDLVREEDVAFEKRERSSLGGDAPISAKMVIGRVARTAMRAGALLRDRDFSKPLLVERNMPVTISFETGGLHLTMKGKAIEAGALGEVIAVQNLTSKRMLQAVVIGAGQARVQHVDAPVGRTASAQP